MCTTLYFFISIMYRVGQKTGPFLECMTPVYDEVGRRSTYQHAELGMSPYLNILGISLEKRYCAENATFHLFPMH